MLPSQWPNVRRRRMNKAKEDLFIYIQNQQQLK
jgi:hypothetical protein